ncbi:hypothetical protein PN499_14575 [Kamptonema animale CS-326]|uniref:hypothetical protein n=1 Tax=Kamptonema animale TaxID=92934 RepID=UPI00232FB6EE|nr:hypothetical protein [Kamptonema animale]MDB9512413.1 hypothetical protein [Kamptonema animale CS-326]
MLIKSSTYPIYNWNIRILSQNAVRNLVMEKLGIFNSRLGRQLLVFENVLDKVTKPLFVTEAFILYRIMHS